MDVVSNFRGLCQIRLEWEWYILYAVQVAACDKIDKAGTLQGGNF
jgi:hypothetical protein